MLVAVISSCGNGSTGFLGGAPTAFLVHGAGGLGNDIPTLTITVPVQDITVPQGVPFLIQWTDADRDDNAMISFQLVDPATNSQILLVEKIEENDLGPKAHTVGTALIPVGTYNLLGIINDGVNPPVLSYAIVANTTTQRVLVTIVGAGEGPPTLPPTVAVVEPLFDLSVTQDDTVRIVVQPTQTGAANVPFDGDSDVTLFLILDTDLDPNNDDPFNPTPDKIVILLQQSVPQGAVALPPFDIKIDLGKIPARPNGDPYYIRATITDGTNRPVHSYAPGTISVVTLASGTVDLFDIGRRVSGTKFGGFSPGANLGSTVKGAADFDNDGVADFIMVARFGNPQNIGPVGEAYLVYGQNKIRFGGTISANSISETISGVVFQAPPVRSRIYWPYLARTEGITDVSIVRDLTGDRRPELIFGLPHVHGMWDSMDYDPGDTAPQQGFSADNCYPDQIVNNYTDQEARLGLADAGYYGGGAAIMVNSQNRDNSDVRGINVNRLERTAVALELVGQFPVPLNVDGRVALGTGYILARADNAAPGVILGAEPSEPGRISGSRFIAGGYDWVHLIDPPREDLFGYNVDSIGDITSDGLDEIIISAPRNERYLADLSNSTPVGFFDPNFTTTAFRGSITVIPGFNYNTTFWRDIADSTGTSRIPLLDHHILPPFGTCNGTPPTPRHEWSPAGEFQIYAENMDDMLGGGKSAGDFNQDGLGDILCSAPLNDRSSSIRDSGAVYIIYTRTPFGETRLSLAGDPVLRPPMLRIRGVKPGDQIGFKQAAGLDVNGDRFDDVFISSPRTDFGGITRDKCTGITRADCPSFVDPGLSLASFNDCQVRFGTGVFACDSCKAFDYDNDGDIDEDDRCVFCCLSGACAVADTCVHGRDAGNCCADMVDNGFVGIIFGGRRIDGDRDITQIATCDLPGVIFYGGHANDLAGWDISSAGDFNQDGFGDILIAAPGEIRCNDGGVDLANCKDLSHLSHRQRVGVVYLIFGGPHLYNTQWNLSDPERGVGSSALPGIVFFSPFVQGGPNEAAPLSVGFLGDINNDGFGDIAIGNPKADFIDLTFPQGPNAPGDDPSVGRRSDAGEVYVIYGNNFGPNRVLPVSQPVCP